jgi:hypothetical protein
VAGTGCGSGSSPATLSLRSSHAAPYTPSAHTQPTPSLPVVCTVFALFSLTALHCVCVALCVRCTVCALHYVCAALCVRDRSSFPIGPPSHARPRSAPKPQPAPPPSTTADVADPPTASTSRLPRRAWRRRYLRRAARAAACVASMVERRKCRKCSLHRPHRPRRTRPWWCRRCPCSESRPQRPKHGPMLIDLRSRPEQGRGGLGAWRDGGGIRPPSSVTLAHLTSLSFFTL